MPYKDPEKRRACSRKSARKAYDANPEHFRERSRKAYASDPEKGRQVARKYRDKYPERVKASFAKWRNKKRAATLLELEQWRKDHPEEAAALDAWQALTPRERRLLSYRRSNARRIAQVRVWGVQYRARKKALRATMDPQELAAILTGARTYQRLYQSMRRTRVQELPATFTPEDEAFMLQYWSYACAACGNQNGFEWFLALDHWIPVKSPECPGTIATNMIPLCHGTGGCNNSKHNLPPEEWLVRRFGARKAKAIAKKVQEYFAIVQARQETSSEVAD
jgi:hypothetical protein